MSTSKQIRQSAWNILRNNYWSAFVVSLVASLITETVGGVSEFASFIGDTLTQRIDYGYVEPETVYGLLAMLGKIMVITSVASFIINIFVSAPVSVGYMGYFSKAVDGNPPISDMFSGFKTNYLSRVGIMLLVSVKVVLWSLLLIVPGIIKTYEYAMIPYILADNPGISAKEAFAMSKDMMTDNKWRFFVLQISFIGWELLCIFTCGIGILFLNPYYLMANAVFYRELKGDFVVQAPEA